MWNANSLSGRVWRGLLPVAVCASLTVAALNRARSVGATIGSPSSSMVLASIAAALTLFATAAALATAFRDSGVATSVDTATEPATVACVAGSAHRIGAVELEAGENDEATQDTYVFKDLFKSNE